MGFDGLYGREDVVMNLSIHPDIFGRFPGLVVGVVVVLGIDNRGKVKAS